MVKFIKKRVYNLDKSYKYNYYQVVNNKKKRISSKKYHTYLKKIAKKKANTLPMIILKENVVKYLPVSQQIGGDVNKDGSDENIAKNFDDLLEKIKKHKNNPNLKLGKTYVIDHKIVEGNNGELKISEQEQKRLQELLKYTDLLFDTQQIYLKDSNGELKKYAVLIPNKIDGSEISKHINYYLDKESYNTFSFNENEPEINDKVINNYLTIMDSNSGSPELLETIVNKQNTKIQKSGENLSKYLLLLNKMSKDIEIKVSNLLSQSLPFNDKNVQSLSNQVVLALIANSQIETKKEGEKTETPETKFYLNNDLIDYNVTYFEGNIEKYNKILESDFKKSLLKTYGSFSKLIRESSNDTYQFDTNHFIPIQIRNIQKFETSDIFSWNSYFEKYNEYREAINTSLIEMDYKSQCEAVKSYHKYLESINEKMKENKRKFQGKSETFLFSSSQECNNTETDLKNSDQTYDMMKGFKNTDNIDLESIVSVVKNLLLLELTILELTSLDKYIKNIKNIITDLINDNDSLTLRNNKNAKKFVEETNKYKTTISNKKLSIFSRISVLKKYKLYLQETQSRNLEIEQNLLNKSKQMNFKSVLTDDIIGKITAISNTLPNINTNLLEEFVNEYKIPISSSSNEINSDIKSQQAMNEIYTLFEFFSNFYKNLNKSKEETCNTISVYNIDKLQKCITDAESSFYPRDEKVDVDIVLLEEQYKDVIVKQTKDIRLGYSGIKKMFDNYKHIHGFFEDQLSISITDFNSKLDKIELEKKQKLEEEKKQQEELEKKKEIENKSNELKELARKAIEDEKELQKRKEEINNQLIENEKNLDNTQTGGFRYNLDWDSSSFDPYLYTLDKVFLEKDKYDDLEYIYLINQGCEAFHKNNIIWTENPRESINLMFSNDKSNTNFVAREGKNLVNKMMSFFKGADYLKKVHPNDDYSTTLLDKNNKDDYNKSKTLERCCEYRLRHLTKEDVSKIGIFSVNWKKDLQKSRSVWTIQKNIYMTPTDEKSFDRYDPGFESKWTDLVIVKKKYPKKLTSLDEMLLDPQAFKRRRALESLIKYSTFGNKIYN